VHLLREHGEFVAAVSAERVAGDPSYQPAFEPIEDWAWDVPAQERTRVARDAACRRLRTGSGPEYRDWLEAVRRSPQVDEDPRDDRFVHTGLKMNDLAINHFDEVIGVVERAGAKVIHLSRHNRLKHALSMYRYHDEEKSQFHMRDEYAPTRVRFRRFNKWLLESPSTTPPSRARRSCHRVAELLAYRRGLIRLLVARDLTTRYKRSVLGVWWTLLNPLLTAGVMYLVFGVAIGGRFGETDEPYVVYLLSGRPVHDLLRPGDAVDRQFDRRCQGDPLEGVRARRGLRLRHRGGRAGQLRVQPLPLILAQWLTGTGVPSPRSWPVPVLAMLALVIGAGMLIAAAAVYFYDVLDLTRVFVQLLQYLTPVFYPLSFIPAEWLGLYKTNPLFSYLDNFRNVMYRGEFGPVWQWWYMAATAVSC
jgi:ABC-2 type transport system permease protein